MQMENGSIVGQEIERKLQTSDPGGDNTRMEGGGVV
jgi:hypothetical protein